MFAFLVFPVKRSYDFSNRQEFHIADVVIAVVAHCALLPNREFREPGFLCWMSVPGWTLFCWAMKPVIPCWAPGLEVEGAQGPGLLF